MGPMGVKNNLLVISIQYSKSHLRARRAQSSSVDGRCSFTSRLAPAQEGGFRTRKPQDWSPDPRSGLRGEGDHPLTCHREVDATNHPRGRAPRSGRKSSRRRICPRRPGGDFGVRRVFGYVLCCTVTLLPTGTGLLPEHGWMRATSPSRRMSP